MPEVNQVSKANMVEVRTPITGLVGYVHTVEYEKDSVLVFQLPRATNMLSEAYVRSALKSLREILPDGKKAIVIGADVNIYEISGPEATALVLKGLI